MAVGGHVDLCTVTLLGGDVNGDDLIDILDLAYVGGRFSSNDSRADINGDGNVNIFDLTIVGGNFKKSAPSPWTSGWAFPVGDARSGSGWRVTNSLGATIQVSGGNWYRGHLGEDFMRNSGTSLNQPVYAAAAGDVIILRPNCGNYKDIVVIKHFVGDMDEPIYSFYGHIDAEGYVREGDPVQKRQQIGVTDDPRPDFVPHLHFEIKNHTALINGPFSSCTDVARGWYISAGYSGKSNDYNGGEFFDPSTDGVAGNRYYPPSRFIQAHPYP
jgi:murein DD-endopeptidase MepM/ murein hydrolase activator NlpD